uniref:Uncharacterized protein n=1 Tax=Anguilla anguilla TaxID=7936 RepID=A0A0E9PQ40_ANGAN
MNLVSPIYCRLDLLTHVESSRPAIFLLNSHLVLFHGFDLIWA